ncbi:MAG: GTPase HflX [Candidatus Omnitrophica bacterium]|nr:GTPase HflX [Candidatus Omnitrophota bacterium]
MWETGRDKKEKAMLVTLKVGEQDAWTAEDDAKELKELARSSGVEVAKEIICHRDKPTPSYFIGRGKAAELADFCQALEMDVVIFNYDLSSTQQRNLEEIVDTKIIDRTQLILDIFAQRAKSMEGKVQVELAQLEYLLPRLTGKGIMLSRLGAGIGTRGPGEKKLEVDKRRIRERIGKLKKELLSLSQRRSSLREYRKHHSLATIAVVGYTNAGKSTLINRLTGARQAARASMFSTLDSVARRLTLANKQKVLFSDTVGFLRRLPHHLIEAFKATLEEVKEADVLLHVLDISSAYIYEHSQAVFEVLTELQAQQKPIIVALNKIDLVANEYSLRRYLKDFRNSVAISALKGTNIDQLLEKISHQLADLMTEVEIEIPAHKMNLLNLIYNEGQVFKKVYRDDKVCIHASIPHRIKGKLEHFFAKKTFDKE